MQRSWICPHHTHTSTNTSVEAYVKLNCAIWDRIREEAVLAATFGKFTQYPAMNQHIWSTGTNYLVESNPFRSRIGHRSPDGRHRGPKSLPVARGTFARESFFHRS